MKLFKQIFIILLFYLLGEILALGVKTVFPDIFIPGTILGMLLLVVALTTKWLAKENVEEVGTFLTNNMAFFFIPAAVSVIEYFDLLKVTIVKILILIVISIIFSFFAIVGSVKLTLMIQAKGKQVKKHE